MQRVYQSRTRNKTFISSKLLRRQNLRSAPGRILSNSQPPIQYPLQRGTKASASKDRRLCERSRRHSASGSIYEGDFGRSIWLTGLNAM